MVNAAAIGARIFILPREVSGCREHLREVSRGHSSYWKQALKYREVLQGSEGLNIR